MASKHMMSLAFRASTVTLFIVMLASLHFCSLSAAAAVA